MNLFPPRKKSMAGQRKAAFSLIELLVAVMIVGVLAVFALQLGGRLRNRAYSAQNLANHRQIAAALLSYAVENRGSLPYAYESPSFSATEEIVTYTRTLCQLNYVSDPRIFFSPLLADKWYLTKPALRKPEISATSPWFYTNYGVNRYGAMPYREKGYIPANLHSVASDGNLSKLMLTRDTYQASSDTPEENHGGGVIWYTGDMFLPKTEKRYIGIVHASFCDGHVEGFRKEELIMTSSSPPETQAPYFSKRYTTK